MTDPTVQRLRDEIQAFRVRSLEILGRDSRTWQLDARALLKRLLTRLQAAATALGTTTR